MLDRALVPHALGGERAHELVELPRLHREREVHVAPGPVLLTGGGGGGWDRKHLRRLGEPSSTIRSGYPTRRPETLSRPAVGMPRQAS